MLGIIHFLLVVFAFIALNNNIGFKTSTLRLILSSFLAMAKKKKKILKLEKETRVMVRKVTTTFFCLMCYLMKNVFNV